MYTLNIHICYANIIAWKGHIIKLSPRKKGRNTPNYNMIGARENPMIL